jgi:hypothetical protein
MHINFIITHINPTEYDPLNLPRTVSNSRFSYDSIHPDALELVGKLMKAQTDHDLRKIIWESFKDLFMDEIAGDRDSTEYREAVFDVWRYYCR